MELCTGLEVFDKFKGMKFDENKTKEVINKIVYAIYYSHLQGVTHRDLKLENIMFENLSEDAQIKIIDWGLSKMELNSLSSTVTGTPQFIAPEVFTGSYNSRCDVWSIGVITYVIIAWKYPYKGSTVKDYLASLQVDKISYDYPNFQKASENCLDFIKGCLQHDPKKRYRTKELYEHPWFEDIRKRNIQSKINENILNNLRLFKTPQCKLQQFIQMHFINLLYEPTELKNIRDQFQKLDHDGEGLISHSELKKAYDESNVHLDDKEIQDIINNVDKRKNNKLDYSEFLTAAIWNNDTIDRNKIIKLFNYFDEDNSGHIDASNLKSLMLRTKQRDHQLPSDEELVTIIKSVIINKDKNEITQSDFLKYFGFDN